MEGGPVVSFEELKTTLTASFTRIYAALKARELQTLRQLEVVYSRKNINSAQPINISYENEPTLLAEIRKYGIIDFKKLKIDDEDFAVEDYIVPDADHMYSYKCIEESILNKEALKQITSEEDCTCFVTVRDDVMDQQFTPTLDDANSIENYNLECESSTNEMSNNEENDDKNKTVQNLSPTQEWLDYIKDQTETEPTQITDSMEHSAIACKP